MLTLTWIAGVVINGGEMACKNCGQSHAIGMSCGIIPDNSNNVQRKARNTAPPGGGLDRQQGERKKPKIGVKVKL
jgi:hypothetical protein